MYNKETEQVETCNNQAEIGKNDMVNLDKNKKGRRKKTSGTNIKTPCRQKDHKRQIYQ